MLAALDLPRPGIIKTGDEINCRATFKRCFPHIKSKIARPDTRLFLTAILAGKNNPDVTKTA